MLMNSTLVCPWSEEGSAGDIEGLFQVGKNGFFPQPAVFWLQHGAATASCETKKFLL